MKEEAKLKYPTHSRKDDEADAWRHAEGMRRIVKEVGWAAAVISGYGNEFINVKDALLGLRMPDVDAIRMNLYNNAMGRKGGSADELLEKGLLRVNKPHGGGPPSSPQRQIMQRWSY